MTRAEEIWTLYIELLEARKYVEWADLWLEDGKLVIAYGKASAPFQTEIYDGREKILSLFSDGASKVKGIKFSNASRAYEISNENIFFVTFDLCIKTIDEYPYTYNNYIACKIALREGRIAEMIEFCDPISRQAFFRHLSGMTPATISV